MKNRIILIAAVISAAPAAFAKVHGLDCILGAPGRLQKVSVVVDDAKPGLGTVALANLDKVEGWKAFERAETQVYAQYTTKGSTEERAIVGATVNMGRSGFIAINPIAEMGGSIYAYLMANASGFNYPNGEKALCVRAEDAAH